MLEYFSYFDTKKKYEDSLLKNKVKKFFGIKEKDNGENSNNVSKSGNNGQGANESSADKKEKKKKAKAEKKDSKEKKKARKLLKESRKNELNLQKELNSLRVDINGEDNKSFIKSNSFSLPEVVERKINDKNFSPIYSPNDNEKYLKFNPIFVQLKIEMLYGSYNIQTLHTQNYLINDNVYMMELMTFDPKKLLISYLPKETRLGISLYVLNRDLSSKAELGSAQIPVFNQNDEMLSGEIKLNIWPLFHIYPRVNCCDQFLMKSNKLKEFCYIVLKFPKFSSPMLYTEKNQFSKIKLKIYLCLINLMMQ